MRYLNEIYFVELKDKKYNPVLGEDTQEEVRTFAQVNITDLGAERSNLLFGDVKQVSKVIRIPPLFEVPKWDFIEFEGVRYSLIKAIEPRNMHTIIVRESYNG